MNKEFVDSLEKAKNELLRAQRRCGWSWCGHVAETSDGLVRHILENHRQEGLKPLEHELLEQLRKANAK